VLTLRRPFLRMGLPLRHRVLLSLTAVAVPLLVMALATSFLLGASNRAFRQAEKRGQALAEVATLQSTVTSSGPAMTAVMGSGNVQLLDQYLAGNADVRARFARLEGRVPAAARPHIEAAGQAWSTMYADLQLLRTVAASGQTANVLVLLVKVGNETIAPEHSLELASKATATDLTVELRRAHRTQSEQQLLLRILALVGVLLVAGLTRQLNRSIGRPLRNLQQAADRLHYGADTADIPLPRTPELAALAGAYNAMTQRIADGRRRLGDSEARYRALITHSSDLVLVLRADTTVLSATPSAERLLGMTPDELIGRPLMDLVVERDISVLVTGLDCGAADEPIEFAVRHADGREVATEAYVVDLSAEPSVRGIVLTLRDVSERKELEERLSHQAFHDSLTGLPNRALLRDRLTHALARRGDERRLALLFLDLNDFKTVNDSLGHSTGDQLLQLVAARLELHLRVGDTAARLGGDEFVVLLEDVEEEEAAAMATRLQAALAEPADLAGVEVFPQAAIGVATSDWAATADEMLAHADAAMYLAKSAPSGDVRFYSPELTADVLRRLELKAELQRALERNELRVHYQPSVDLATGRIRGAEALLRWQHPEHGLVPPLDFVPLAEETGLIVPIGRYVLLEACAQLASWQATFGRVAPASINVNVSGRQLTSPDFVGHVQEALRGAGLPAESLVLEITETVLVGNDEVLLERLRALKRLGVRLAIDDFGTGYSSLAYLQRLPVDILKIDKSFVDELGIPGHKTSLVATIAALARDLHLETVAEGIEREGQATALRALDCEHGQGFLFGRPGTADQMRERLAEQAVRRTPSPRQPGHERSQQPAG
jgi:diguanylate cyclase (GGDEF)-like protein/PAS domain S-box-containing protein